LASPGEKRRGGNVCRNRRAGPENDQQQKEANSFDQNATQDDEQV
jgi:hypothetical protein